MDTNLASAALEAFSILLFGIFSLLIVDITLKRKYSIKKSLALSAVLFIIPYILLIFLRLYAHQFSIDQEIDFFGRQIDLSGISNMLIELSAIMISTFFVYTAVLKGYECKTSAKVFAASFAVLISMIASTFFSDYAMLAYNNLTAEGTVLVEKSVYVILQTVLLIITLVIYDLFIKNKVKKLISDTN